MNLNKQAHVLTGFFGYSGSYLVKKLLKKAAKVINNGISLFNAAKMAKVRKIVHILITNPSLNSPLEYCKWKKIVEKNLIESQLPYSILRPSVLFDGNDILINNIAWALRIFPIFGAFGDGNYRLRPIHVEDLAELMLKEGQTTTNNIINAVGPENFKYRELAQTLCKITVARPKVDKKVQNFA